MNRWEQIEGGIWGLLVGDAAGVPYEFREPWELPSKASLGPRPPADFVRSYRDVRLGTWSDDGAQALSLLASLISEGGQLNLNDLAARLVAWETQGKMAVGGHVFDVGIQTGQALSRLSQGTRPEQAGLSGERNNGNGSLMRVLPLALLHNGSESELVHDAHLQSRITHGHPRSQVCCALYCLWARGEMIGWDDPWETAVQRLKSIYSESPLFLQELREHIDNKSEPNEWGSGYVVDCLLSVRAACRQGDYPAIIREAISYGRDTDTTACVAGGIAGIRHGIEGIPSAWRALLRGRKILDPLMESLSRFCRDR